MTKEEYDKLEEGDIINWKCYDLTQLPDLRPIESDIDGDTQKKNHELKEL